MVFFSYNLLHDVMMQLDFVFEKHKSSRMKNVVSLRKGQALLTDEFSYTVYVLLLTGVEPWLPFISPPSHHKSYRIVLL